MFGLLRLETPKFCLQGIIFEKTTCHGEFNTITSVLFVHEDQARLLSEGKMKVILSERLDSKEAQALNNTISANIESEGMSRKKKQKKGSVTQAVGPATHSSHAADYDDIEEPANEAAARNCPRVQLMTLMMMQLNSAIRERFDEVKRSVFNTSVQAKIAQQAPRTLAELHQLTISGLSINMKKKYGKYIIQAVGQVDAFLKKYPEHEERPLDSFELDIDAILGPPIMTANEVGVSQEVAVLNTAPDWGDSDDEWEIMPSENPEF